MSDIPTPNAHSLPLTTSTPLPQAPFHRVFGLFFSAALLLHLLHRFAALFFSTPSFLLNLVFLICDVLLAFMWLTTHVLRINLILREDFPHNLEKVVHKSDFPRLDVFVCTADPYKEPPIALVNTALSVMAYEYPPEKISVYVSDDGGSSLTLFALMEAAKFAPHWLPFCRRNNLIDRCPQVFFSQSKEYPLSAEGIKIQNMYEELKEKVARVLAVGKVDDDDASRLEAFRRWTEDFKRHDHPALVEILLDSSSEDDDGHNMPNLIYLSREKRPSSPHHFKAGALNALIRVSAALTNAPVILTLDCDMFSNDPQTPARALCHFCDPAMKTKLAYLQFPQRFQGINKNDIYAGEYQRLYQIQPQGFDGLLGPNYLGSACFFQRRAFFGPPDTLIEPGNPNLSPNEPRFGSITSEKALRLAHEVAACNYEDSTEWGSKIGIRYGSLSEDILTGYLMKSEGWRGHFTYPERPAFLGDAPTTFLDMLNQQKRWTMGLLQIGFSRFCPFTHGVKFVGVPMALGYAQYFYWPFWSIPIVVYALVPQLAILHEVPVFPEVGSPWLWVNGFLFVGAYMQDYCDFVIAGGTLRKWWNDQRIWAVRGVSCCLFGAVEYLLKWAGLSSFSFNVTSKFQDDDQGKRYEDGVFEFGSDSAMFVSMTVVAMINLWALLAAVVRGRAVLIGEVVLAMYGVACCLPIYDAIAFRKDSGKLPMRSAVKSAVASVALYLASCLIF